MMFLASSSPCEVNEGFRTGVFCSLSGGYLSRDLHSQRQESNSIRAEQSDTDQVQTACVIRSFDFNVNDHKWIRVREITKSKGNGKHRYTNTARAFGSLENQDLKNSKREP
jgi:hypothetical protein